VDAESVESARDAAGAVVSQLSTDARMTARDVLDQVWRRAHPERARTIQADLVESRAPSSAATPPTRAHQTASVSGDGSRIVQAGRHLRMGSA
jgi:hypothetical protein